MSKSPPATRVGGPAARRAKVTFPATPLKVFLGYGDLSAVRTATATITDTIRQTRRRFTIQPLLWNFAQLSDNHWRDRAVQAAQEADIIVLASSSPTAFTPAIERWVDRLLATNRGRRTTLVAISGPNDAWTISIEEPPLPPPRPRTPSKASIPDREAEPSLAAICN